MLQRLFVKRMVSVIQNHLFQKHATNVIFAVICLQLRIYEDACNNTPEMMSTELTNKSADFGTSLYYRPATCHTQVS